MARRVLRVRAADDDIFEAIRAGRKTVETRAATVKYRPITAGDTLVFSCKDERFELPVGNVAHFDSVGEMLDVIDWREIFPDAKSEVEVAASYKTFPGYEQKISENGILAFYLSTS